MKAKTKSVGSPDSSGEQTSVVQESHPLMHEVGAFEAKTHLSGILGKVADGHTYYVTKRGKRIAEIRPIVEKPNKRELGFWKGRISIAADFDAPLNDFKEYM